MNHDAREKLFQSEYELELEHWLRRRFRSVCIGYLVIGAVLFLVRILMIQGGEGDVAALAITIPAGLLYLATIGYFLIYERHRAGATRSQLLRAASLMILALGAISLAKAILLSHTTGEQESILLSIFFWHFIACLFLPWTPQESLRPIIPLLAAWTLGVLFLPSDQTVTGRILTAVFGPGIVIPGLGICAIRLKQHSEQFRSRMVGKHFLTMRQELAKARSIHESMFPAPHDDGFVRFEYTYLPMRELGGDFVHLNVGSEGLVHLTLMDVTGHGLAAALTVNRLYGELERIRAESPRAEPGDVLSLLNRYVHLTLVRHNIYVTAMCVTLDPYLGQLLWANAGHPPGYLRGVNGVVTPLPATTVLLGALGSDDFMADQKSIELSPGDIVLCFTDGVYEAADRQGRRMGLERLARLMHCQPPPRNWPQFIASAVQKHNAGRAEDDILIASLTIKAMRSQTAQAARAFAAT